MGRVYKVYMCTYMYNHVYKVTMISNKRKRQAKKTKEMNPIVHEREQALLRGSTVCSNRWLPNHQIDEASECQGRESLLMISSVHET